MQVCENNSVKRIAGETTETQKLGELWLEWNFWEESVEELTEVCGSSRGMGSNGWLRQVSGE